MKEALDIIVVVLFIFVLFVIIGGFNRQMVEKNKERARKAKERQEGKLTHTATKDGAIETQNSIGGSSQTTHNKEN